MGNIINRVFESAGPDGKVRGTPQQIIDKYQALARDAQVPGDRVAAESYLQHSEHYSRLLGEAQRQQLENRFNQQEREDGAAQRDGAAASTQPAPAAAGDGAAGRLGADDDRSGRFRRHGRPDRDPGGPPRRPVDDAERPVAPRPRRRAGR